MLHPKGDDERLKELRPRAKTDAQGKFVLWTYERGDGAPAGEYDVTVVWRGKLTGDDVHPDEADAGPDKLKGRYAEPAKSGLTATIASGKNELPAFQLK